MKSITIFLLFLFCCCALKAQNKNYYVALTGSDGNSGLTPSTAWKTLAKVSSFDFKPGDRIFFRGGEIFSGSLSFSQTDIGTPSDPIYIGSFGSGRASIASNSSTGISLYNTGGLEIHNLIIFGNGPTTNTSNGIEFYMDQINADLEHIIVDSVEVYGYGGRGILIGAWSTPKGYNHLRITNVSVHDNGRTGIETYGYWPGYSHKDFYVGFCRAYRNYGRTDITNANTGSGIILSGIDGAIIEYCEAFENGQNNRNSGGGPVGIWFYEVRNGVIQFCESHHNKAGLQKDGGGFDLDGGCQNCTIQYCYSHDNEGAGYGLFEYGSSNAFVNNTVRYNISQNDGRKNSTGGIYFWGEDASHKITNCEVYNNTIYVDNKSIVNGTPAAVVFLYNHMSGIKIRNNIFYVTEGAQLINATHAMNSSSVLFQNNNYYSTDIPSFKWGSETYASLAAWKVAAPGQEKHGSFSLGSDANPLLANPGSGATIRPASGGSLQSLTAYHLQGESPMINAGMDLQISSGVNPGSKDYYGNANQVNGAFDIGAHEFPLYLLPINFTKLDAFYGEEGFVLNWSYAGNITIKNAFLEISNDGKKISTLSKMSGPFEPGMVFTEKADGIFSERIYCRIKLESYTGRTVYSKAIVVHPNKNINLHIYPNPAGNQIMLTSPFKFKRSTIIIKNIAGMTVGMQKTNPGDVVVSVDLTKFTKGVYFGYITDKGRAEQTFSFLKQ